MGIFRKKDTRLNQRRTRSRDPVLQVTARANAKGRDNAHKIGALVLLFAAVAGTVWAAVSGVSLAGEHLFAQNDRFIIRRIEITSTGSLTPSHLREYAQVSEGQNLFAIDLQQISRNLERTPRVRSAKVRRILPDALEVQVQERTALARMAEGAGGFPMAVDRDGFILGPSGGRGLPLINGVEERGLAPGSVVREEKTLDALEMLDLCEQSRLGELLRIQVVGVKNPDYLELILASGARVDFGRSRLKWRLDKLAELITTNRQLGQEIEYADLTVDQNFPVRFSPVAEARTR